MKISVYFSVKLIRHALRDEDSARNESLKGNLSRPIYDLFWQCLKGRIRRDSVISALNDILVRVEAQFEGLVCDIYTDFCSAESALGPCFSRP